MTRRQALRSESRAEGGSLPRSVVGGALSAPAQPVAPCVLVGPPLWILIFSVDLSSWQSFKSGSSGLNKHVPRVLEFAFSPCSFSLMPGGQSRYALRDGFGTQQYASILCGTASGLRIFVGTRFRRVHGPGPFDVFKSPLVAPGIEGICPSWLHGADGGVCRLLYVVFQTLSLGPSTVTAH